MDIELMTFPQIKLAQSFFPDNGDGYMYFVKTISEDGIAKQVPCLITNDKREIRLDLLKKKGPHKLALIDTKYELPFEVPENFMDINELSVNSSYIQKWQADELPDSITHPRFVYKEIKSFVRSTYAGSEVEITILSLWIYATYYYSLFRSGFPYLTIIGTKGSGKSTLENIIQLLGFNAGFAHDCSVAALYRTVAMFGGTLIIDGDLMDEETPYDPIGTVMKAGYSDKGSVHRINADTGNFVSYNLFCPKVITGICGVEDVIADRCIQINTRLVDLETLSKLTDIYIYNNEKKDIVRSITSRAAISALMHFNEINQVFKETEVKAGNARLSMIIRPLAAIAKVVGEECEEKLVNYFYK
jgi:hypothetical protein